MPDPLDPDPTSAPSDQQQNFDVDGALSALKQSGLSQDDAESKVLGHLSANIPFDVDGALSAGASKRQIIDHLASQSPTEKASAPAPTPQEGYRDWKDWLTGGFFDPTSSGGLLKQGSTAVASGVRKMMQPTTPQNPHPVYSGANEVLTGAGKLATPFAIGATLPALAAAPVPTMLGLAGGTAGAYATGKAAKDATAAYGGSPEAQQLAETGGNIVGGTAGGMFGAHLPDLRTIDPRYALSRVFGKQLETEELPRTISLIKAANAQPDFSINRNNAFGGAPEYSPAFDENRNLDSIQAANRTINALQSGLDPWIARTAGRAYPADSVIDATKQAISEMPPSDRGPAQVYLEKAQMDYGQPMTAMQKRNALRDLNDRLSPFFKKSEANQNSALTHIPDAILTRQRDALAESLYRDLDPENDGAGPRYIQSLTGPVLNFRDAMADKEALLRGQQPLSTLGTWTDKLKQLLPEITRKITVPDAVTGDSGTGRGLHHLQRSFDAIPDTEGANLLGSLPQPGQGRLLLGAGARQMPGSPDASGSYSKVGPPHFGSTPTQTRTLGPATSQVGVSGTIIPDLRGALERDTNTLANTPQLPPAQFEGRITQPPVRRGGTSRQLPPPTPGQPPINLLPTGPGTFGPAANPNTYGQDVARPMKGEIGSNVPMADVLRNWTSRALAEAVLRGKKQNQ